VSTVKFGFYCTCGGAMTGEVGPPDEVARIETVFGMVHDGPGHSRTDRITAHNARRRKSPPKVVA